MDDITEVYVVEEYDLEEGEITDDGVIDVEETPEPKKKKLPKRYCLHQKKVLNEKRKKDCKHSRHKVKNKEKASPILNGIHKKHKSSCPLQYQMSSTGKHDSVKHVSPVNTKPLNNGSSFIKSAFKNFTSPPRPVQKFHKPCQNIQEDFDGIDNYPDLLLAYKKSRGHLDPKSKLNDHDNQIRHCSPKNSTKQSPSETFAKSKSQIKHSLSEKSSPKQIDTKQSLSEKTTPKKIEIKRRLSEKVSPLKIEMKSPLHEKVSPLKSEINCDLNKKASLPMSDNKQPLNENTSAPELRQAQNVLAVRKVEKRSKEEESEDEEELRKIALATCVKRNMERQKAENINHLSNSPSHSLSNQSSVTMLGDNGSSDNYEVVDMELDDENFTEDLDVEDNLFVIDNNPIMSSEFKQDIFYGQSYMCDNSKNEGYLPPEKSTPNKAQSNEEFEEALLRAELIASINSKKEAPVASTPTSSPTDKFPALTKKAEKASLQGQIPKPAVAYTKSQTLQPVSANVKRTNVVKLNNSNLPNSKKITSPKPRNINAIQERLIITLNNDSSSDDESDEDGEESNENGQENVATGIDALISNARHKSDIKANGANLNHVSSLSKAQQEEYKKLRNILAEKEPMTIIPQIVKEKSTAGHQNLNFLTNKISVAKEKLDKELEMLCNTEKEVLNQKKVYITSKLKFQHLQEQLHAAKLSKAANLKTWKLCEAKLVNAKNIVAKQKTLISWLEAEFKSRRLQIEQNSSSPIL